MAGIFLLAAFLSGAGRSTAKCARSGGAGRQILELVVRRGRRAGIDYPAAAEILGKTVASRFHGVLAVCGASLTTGVLLLRFSFFCFGQLTVA